jgi:hypothetical protein
MFEKLKEIFSFSIVVNQGKNYMLEKHLRELGFKYSKIEKKVTIMSDCNEYVFITLDYEKNELSMSTNNVLHLKINFIPNNRLLTDLLLSQSIENINKNTLYLT